MSETAKEYPTLSRFFNEQFIEFWIDAQQLNQKTRWSYTESIDIWKRTTGDPPVNMITPKTCSQFVTGMAELRGKQPGSKMMRSSIGKHCRNCDTVLKTCGPRGRHNKFGQGVLDYEPPFIVIPKQEKNRPRRNWTVDEIKALYRATSVMTQPQVPDVSPSDWWAAFVLCGFYAGFRIGTLLSIRYDMINEHWIEVPGSCAKQNKGIRQFIRPELLEAFEKIRQPGRAVILDYPRSRRYIYNDFDILLAAAGIPEHRWFRTQSLRKTHATEYARAAAGSTNAIRGAQQSCGHSNAAVTLGHYLGADL